MGMKTDRQLTLTSNTQQPKIINALNLTNILEPPYKTLNYKPNMTGLTIFLAVLVAVSASVPIAAPEVKPLKTACTTCRRNVETEE